MNAIISQIPDYLAPLSSFGVGGICIAFLMWRDVKRDEREAVRNADRDAKLDRVAEALNHLTRALTLEVLTRPNVVERARNESQQLLSTIGGQETR